MTIFEAVADPTRRNIVELVALRELPAGDIAAVFDVSRPAISRHLRVLRQAGLLSVRGDGQRRLYRLRPDALDELDAWLNRTRAFWNERLDSLNDHIGRSPE
ncbi:MAG TPA: metalloregulator ArsR/SmtB family transcription factor [Candidatus Krumholzibacteria bacterium]